MCACVRVCVRDEVEAGPSLFTDHSVTEVLLIGHFEVVLLFSLFLPVLPSLSPAFSLSPPLSLRTSYVQHAARFRAG